MRENPSLYVFYKMKCSNEDTEWSHFFLMKMYFPNEWPLASKEWSLDWLIKPCIRITKSRWWAAGLHRLPSLLVKILDKIDFYLYETLKNIMTVLVWNPFFTATDFLWSQVTASFHPSCLTPPRNISLATVSREGQPEKQREEFELKHKLTHH